MSIRGRRNRTPLWSLVAACLIVALALGTAQALAQSSAVTDVPKTHWAYQAVESLVAKGYLELYPDSTFQGDEPVSSTNSLKSSIEWSRPSNPAR